MKARTRLLTAMRSAALTTCAVLAVSPAAARADDALLTQALEAYRSAQETSAASERPAAFARAERLFSAAAEQGPASADLWTNVGTAALQAEHLGAAVLAWRRALELDPDHRRARQNLEHARTLLPAWVPRHEGGGFLDSFFAWHEHLSPAERRGVAALAFLCATGFLAAAIVTGSGALRLFGAGPALAWAAMLAASFAAGDAPRAAVLTADETVARAADSRNAPARFAEPLPAGTEVTIGEARGEWTRVVLADGRDAWVSSAALRAVSPSDASTD